MQPVQILVQKQLSVVRSSPLIHSVSAVKKCPLGGGLHGLKRHSESALSSGISHHIQTTSFQNIFARKRKKRKVVSNMTFPIMVVQNF